MNAKKSLGQNFLMHARTAERIAVVANIPAGATVLEIGPGTGMLTRPLLARAGRVIAIEKDDALAEELTKSLTDENLTLIHDDALTFDTESITEPYVLVANIPYYITGELIRKFLTAPHKPSSMTLLVQKEVAERIARAKKESILSLSVKVFGTPKYCFTVPRGAFVPAPNVDSAVLSITDIHAGFTSEAEERHFFEVVRAGFAHKRKLLARNLEDIASREAVAAAFLAANLPEKARAEDLHLPEWLILAKTLRE
jgi:16S rRNA (adenine1518-N6/adenine1519-N6)-dimethyltransferase